jgi:hypothetical protein
MMNSLECESSLMTKLLLAAAAAAAAALEIFQFQNKSGGTLDASKAVTIVRPKFISQ